MATESVPFDQPTRPWKTRALIASVLVGVAVVFAVVGYVVAHGLSSSSPASSTVPGPPRGGATAPGLGAGLVAAGTVQSVDRGAHTFTLVSRTSAAITVDVTATTTFRDRAGSTSSFGQLVVGDRVGVAGKQTGTTVVATSVILVNRGFGGGIGGGGGFGGAAAPSAFGVVKTIDRSAQTFVVESRAGSTVTVTASSTTTYVDLSGSNASFSTLAVGARVAVTGTTTSTGVLDASRVTILPAAGSGGAFSGGGFGGSPPGVDGALPG